MKVLDNYNIRALSKVIYQEVIISVIDQHSLNDLSKKLILGMQNGYNLEKIKGVLSSELIITYGLSIHDKDVDMIAQQVCSWYNN